MIETNLDDQSPELTGWLTGRLMDKGALDVYLTPVYMKKNRPGVKLSVLSDSEHREALTAEILRQSSTLGVRFHPVERFCLPREFTDVKTDAGPVRIKTARLPDGSVKGSPEYESARQAAENSGIPLKEVFDQAGRALALHLKKDSQS